ncbi:hypothetical protein QYE76_032732 [Lolium multiflorum]|uniref:Nuclease HARBI1 n=1 Tax=Lolium multiflorum TaxID=4521 RepID=A0AAD8QXE3_LOLMU|nr:hypothetical protein QYE76_032732 [Lolium multiflorum]
MARQCPRDRNSCKSRVDADEPNHQHNTTGRRHRRCHNITRASGMLGHRKGHAPPCNYEINGHQYTKGYYLADGIYPKWVTFVKTISAPSGQKNSHFAARQEACRKDVERAFGVLQAQFAIVRYPALSWSHDQMWEVMQACVIMHNMIIEDDRKNQVRRHVGPYECQGPLAEVDHELPTDFADFLAMHAEIRDNNVHDQLQADLVEHMWRIKGLSANAATP